MMCNKAKHIPEEYTKGYTIKNRLEKGNMVE